MQGTHRTFLDSQSSLSSDPALVGGAHLFSDCDRIGKGCVQVLTIGERFFARIRNSLVLTPNSKTCSTPRSKLIPSIWCWMNCTQRPWMVPFLRLRKIETLISLNLFQICSVTARVAIMWRGKLAIYKARAILGRYSIWRLRRSKIIVYY
jgi:hypothetical protein